MKNNDNNSRRNFIKNSAIVGLGFASAKKTFSIGKKNKSLEDTVGHNGFTYKVDKSWSKQNINTLKIFRKLNLFSIYEIKYPKNNTCTNKPN